MIFVMSIHDQSFRRSLSSCAFDSLVLVKKRFMDVQSDYVPAMIERDGTCFKPPRTHEGLHARIRRAVIQMQLLTEHLETEDPHHSQGRMIWLPREDLSALLHVATMEINTGLIWLENQPALASIKACQDKTERVH